MGKLNGLGTRWGFMSKAKSSDNAGDALIGAVIENRFVLESVIGRGGLSTVYRASHEKAGLTVAVKILHSNYSDTTESVERFKREAAIINHLNHPNVVHMYSSGVLSGEIVKASGESEFVDSARPYLVLECLDGFGLDDLLSKEGRLGLAAVKEVVQGVVKGLHEAHELGIIHRDIKPSNVMLVRTVGDFDKDYPGEFTRMVKLLDFGIAKCNKCHDEEKKALTQPGYIFGSPLYMSPEQCMGRDIDHRTDIYSLGCMLYELLVGEPPFDGENAMHTFAMHIYEQPKSLRSHENLGHISLELDEIVLKCLAKEPAARFGTVDEFYKAFDGAVSRILTKKEPALEA